MKKRLLSWLPTLAVVCVALIAVSNRQNIADWWKLRNYQPPARIEALASNTAMTGEGRKLFYINEPELLTDKALFTSHCKITEETIILGCYTGTGIYLYDVTDPRLAGVHEVTAAHEMLHAAYDRLKKSEREKLDRQLTDFFATVTDERVKSSVENYRKRDPSIVPNELHSILATEVRSLTPELEEHYSRYFTNRVKVVEYSEHYEAAFEDLKNKVAEYDRRLEALKGQIAQNEARLKAMSEEIQADRQSMDAKLAANDIEGYNAAVPGFNQKVRRYNALLEQTNALIAEYNRLVNERNALAAEQEELIKAIDTRQSTEEQE